MAGYSGTPLSKKLGIKAGHRVCVVGAYDGEIARLLAPLPDSVTLHDSLRGRNPFDVQLLFTKSRRDLAARFEKLQARMTVAGGLWICWPKKASGVATDLGDGLVRSHGLACGLVDNKVCAVDETWSALRFVIRVADRAGRVR